MYSSALKAVGAVLVFWSVSITTAEAASLYLDPPRHELHRGDSVTMAVRLDVDQAAGECINAVKGVITYEPQLQLVDVSRGSSILQLWVTEPEIDQEAGVVRFEGGIPNGYCGRVARDPRLTNHLVELVFQSPGMVVGSGGADRNVTIAFSDESRVYRNDGFGTEVVPDMYGAEIELLSTVGSELQNPWREAVLSDEIPPAPFSITLEQGNIYGGQYYIIFNTTDKQTGIDEYQVMEEPIETLGSFQWGRADAPWITAESPYVLDDQSLNSVIRVRAIDKAGNETMATLVPEEGMRTMSRGTQLLILLAGGGLIILTLILIVGLWWRRRRSAGSLQSAAGEEFDAVAVDEDDEEETDGEADEEDAEEFDDEFYDTSS